MNYYLARPRQLRVRQSSAGDENHEMHLGLMEAKLTPQRPGDSR